MIGLVVIFALFYRFIPADRIGPDTVRFNDTRADPEFLQDISPWIDSVLNSLTLEQQVAQMIMVAAYSNNNNRNEAEVAGLVRDQKIGGLVFFQGTPYHQAELTNYFQSLASTPLLIAMDAEWGLAMRLDSTIRYPRQLMLGAIEDDRLIFDMGSQIARQLRRLGVHINFAPVIDLNNNPENPVINSRSFGSDIQAVTRKALFYMIGLENNGILAVAKHFPGHGDTDTDSHETIPLLKHSRTRLDSLELFPYRELIYNGLSGVMTAHLYVPALDPQTSIPASLSAMVIDSLLKKELGFKGLVFSDALSMKGITDQYKSAKAAEMALLAGNDILLMPEDAIDAIDHITRLVKRGKISRDIIDQRCRKILAAKYWAGLHHYSPVDLRHLHSDLNKPEYVLLQRKLTESALTVLRNQYKILPLRHLDTLKVAAVAFSDLHDSVFQQTLGLYMPVKSFLIKTDDPENTDSILSQLVHYNLIIASVHSNDPSPFQQFGINDRTIELVDSLSARQDVILALFANPYILNRFDKPDRLRSVIVSYENSSLVQEISAQAVFGAIDIPGSLPVSLLQWSGPHAGIDISGLGRLKFTIPLEAGMNADTLARIDTLIKEAIDNQAIPGCQLLIARRGKVILNKTFGTKVYKGKQPVCPTDLYDLASVTKVAATTQVIMKLTDEGCIELSQKLSAYLPYLNKTNKKDLLIRDILLHQSGLLPFIQLYYSALEPVFNNQQLISTTLTETNPLKIGNGQYLNRYTRFRDEIIANRYSGNFPYQVADKMYITKSWPDSIYKGIADSKLNDKKEYVYSDLGFILLKQLADSITGVPFEEYLDSVFYGKLGAGRLCFNPLNRFSADEIAPTEDDQLFRKQKIRGYVHDPRAAMFGGIAGHAGLFGNSVDLAKLLQMMLNRGEYAGERYISPETIELFTKDPLGVTGSRRGLGWDKPEPDRTRQGPSCISASPVSYGHTGFTGTIVWVDPAFDLIYIFLSNRVYPDAANNKLLETNVRTAVQQVVYNAIMDR
jgi:beta-glucosidase-like glycosyl hydrolase/CubicO group peptidase (beta-lactamase class C family)